MKIRKTTRELTAAALLGCALLAASPAPADDDAETRFHKAYEAEVVDGKLADAARVYLALMNDAAAPPALRAEAKFRFAVTAVLLGRADESRAHLDALLADPATSESLRARAREYLDAAKGIGLGTELDRKLQALVFDLGRITDAQSAQTVYRDFEIIGRPAVPMLRRLLTHTDTQLRLHAYRLLLRLDEPGLADAWRPEFATRGLVQWQWIDLSKYLAAHTDQRDAFEARLLALPKDELSEVLGEYAAWPLTAGFLGKARDAGVAAPQLLYIVQHRGIRDADVTTLLRAWLADPDRTVARIAADLVVYQTPRETTAAAEATALADALLSAYRDGGTQSLWIGGNASQGVGPRGTALLEHLKAIPTPHLIDRLAELVAVEPTEQKRTPLTDGLANLVATAIEARSNSNDDFRRYGDVVVAAAERFAAMNPADVSGLSARLKVVLSAHPTDVACARAARFFAPEGRERWATCVGGLREHDLAVALAATRAAPDRARPALIQATGLTQTQTTGFPQISNAEDARAVLRAIPEFMAIVTAAVNRPAPPVAVFRSAAALVPAEEARRALLATLDAMDMKGTEMTNRTDPALRMLLMAGAGDDASRAYAREVVLPVAADLWPRLPPQAETFVLDTALSLLSSVASPPRSDVDLVVSVVSSRPEALSDGSIGWLSSHMNLVPAEAWLPRLPAGRVNGAFPSPQTPEAARALFARLAPTPADATPAVRAWIRICCPPEVRSEFLERLLREAPFEIVDGVINEERGGRSPMVSAEAVQAACDRMLRAEGPLPEGALASAVTLAALRRPSDALVPAVRRLLAGPAKYDVASGIAAAARLGREEFLPDLTRALDATDPDLRDAARKAIDAIVELRKLRESAR